MTRSEFIRSLGLSSSALMALYCMGGLTACSNEEPDPNNNNNGNGKLDLNLDLNSADYSKLKTNGEFAIVKGQPIIVARKPDGNFVAVAKDCTHQGTQLVYQSANDRFNCPAHGSNFSATGSVINGPAAAALKQYQTEVKDSGNTLRVYEG
jgi:cytochrome b6-f complex iron-sulfur subunit